MVSSGLLFYREVLFAYSADGAYPILGEILEGCAWSDAAVGIAYFGVINITACVANVLFHNVFFVLRVNNMVNSLNYSLGSDALEAGIVAALAGFVAIDAARTAV